jgi:hypothetical protein
MVTFGRFCVTVGRPSHNVWELRITNYELRITNYELRVTNYELRITSYELRVTNYELRVTSYELRITNYNGLSGSARLTYGGKNKKSPETRLAGSRGFSCRKSSTVRLRPRDPGD